MAATTSNEWFVELGVAAAEDACDRCGGAAAGWMARVRAARLTPTEVARLLLGIGDGPVDRGLEPPERWGGARNGVAVARRLLRTALVEDVAAAPSPAKRARAAPLPCALA